MDPTEALEQIRKIRARVLRDEGVNPDDSVKLAELIEGLDDWLGKSGFLPEQWLPCRSCSPRETAGNGLCFRHGRIPEQNPRNEITR